MKVLFAITTGRADFKETLDLVAQNFASFGQFTDNHIGLAVNYDCSFLGLADDDFIYKTEYSGLFGEIIYIGQKNVPEYIDLMVKSGVDPSMAQILSQATGYSNKKNLVYLEAIRNGYDIVLFWDDDEYPFVCNLSGDSMSWLQTDILGAHISAYKNLSADVAFGFYTGYASPIPLNLDTRLSKETAHYLGGALSVASDVVNSGTFTKTDQIFKGLQADHLAVKEIEFIDGGKWISGGNLSIKVDAIKKGIVPPFYTPPSTRADDTILSMGLEQAKVVQVPAGIFHDAFGEYKSMRFNSFPETIIRRSEVDQSQIERFCSALKGWFGYAPIFLRIRDGKSYGQKVESMVEKLKMINDGLFQDLPEAKKIFNDVSASDLLEKFNSSAESDYDLMHKCYEEWKKVSYVK
jgi:hypothetical protein